MLLFSSPLPWALHFRSAICANGRGANLWNNLCTKGDSIIENFAFPLRTCSCFEAHITEHFFFLPFFLSSCRKIGAFFSYEISSPLYPKLGKLLFASRRFDMRHETPNLAIRFVLELSNYLRWTTMLHSTYTFTRMIFCFLFSCSQVFSKAEIMFSTNGRHYFEDPITYTYMEDKVFESSRNVTIKLHRRVGRFVKMKLYFSNQWIMISEVVFDSGTCT